MEDWSKNLHVINANRATTQNTTVAFSLIRESSADIRNILPNRMLEMQNNPHFWKRLYIILEQCYEYDSDSSENGIPITGFKCKRIYY